MQNNMYNLFKTLRCSSQELSGELRSPYLNRTLTMFLYPHW